MQHVDDATLRLSIEANDAGDDALGGHLEICAACRERRTSIVAAADFAARVFAESVAVDVSAAAVRLHARSSAPALAFASRRAYGLAGALAAAALICAFVLTPLRGIAEQFLTVFEPDRVTPIALGENDIEQLRLLPNLSAFGTMSGRRLVPTQRTTLAVATAKAGFVPHAIAYPPANVRLSPRVYAVPPQSTTFTFDAAKVAGYERRTKGTLPPMPAGLDGTTVHITTGPGIVRSWGAGVVFVESKAPRVASSGAGIEVVEAYLTSLPNVPPDLAKRIRSIGDPSRTLPVPVLIDRGSARDVTIGSADGTLFVDRTSGASGIVWVNHGMLYAVFGPIDEAEAIALARSVH